MSELVHIAGEWEDDDAVPGDERSRSQKCSRCGMTIQRVSLFGDLTWDDFPGYDVGEEVTVDWRPPYRRAKLTRLQVGLRPPDCHSGGCCAS